MFLKLSLHTRACQTRNTKQPKYFIKNHVRDGTFLDVYSFLKESDIHKLISFIFFG